MDWKLLKMHFLDLPYPNRCDCCYARIPYDQQICPACLAALEQERITYADWAANQSAQPWEAGAVLYSYTDTARNGIIAMKEGDRGFAQFAGTQLAEAVREICAPESLSFVTWVPTERQSALRQHELPAEARSVYAQRFQYVGGSLDGKRILLVDDVLTTGSTLRRCTDLLLDAGAESVCIAAACARVPERKGAADADDR